MTNNHFSREELLNIIETDHVQCGEASALARMALAAMDSEPATESEQLAIENFRSAMEGIGHIRRTLEETFGGLHGTHVEPDVLAECKAICDAIYASYRHAQPAPVVPEGLNPETTDLVLRFASALADKLYKAEQKYGRSTIRAYMEVV